VQSFHLEPNADRAHRVRSAKAVVPWPD
jgi:hypothetical protein